MLDLPSVIARLTTGPAAILGRDLGRLKPGRTADVCVFDPQETWIPGPETLVSQGHNTPFQGRPLKGRVRWTLHEGRGVFERA